MSKVRETMASLLEGVATFPFKIIFWDSGERTFGVGEPEFTVRFTSEAAAARVLSSVSLGFGEGYTDGEIEVEGDLVRCCSLTFVKEARKMNTTWANKARILRLALKYRNSRRGSRRNVARHYDLGNDFYRLWLDPNLQYSCAYYTDPARSLAEAQIAKMDHVCRKLRLREGQTLLETGCGWGGFALHAARHYGVKVTAYNISKEQIAHARWWAEEEGLSDRVTFVHDDYRNVRGDFDAFASIGMLEHVGKGRYKDLCRIVSETLKPGGRGLLHFIGKHIPRRLNAWLTTYIFPGAYGPALEEVLPVLGRFDLIAHDVENLRLHYARTLEHWLAAFEGEVDTVRTMFDDRFVRMWRFYLVGAITAFKYGGLHLYQVLFDHGLTGDIPLTRDHLYRTGDGPTEIPTWSGPTQSS